MAVITGSRHAAIEAASSEPPRHRPVVGTSAVAAAGVGLAFIVARDGSPLWQALRLVAVIGLTGAAFLAVRGRASAGRAASALAIGAVITPVGVGVGGPYLAKTGLTATAAAGLTVLFAGLALVGTGLVGMWRSTRMRWSIPATAGSVVLLAVLCWTLGQAVAATNVPRPALGSATPSDRGLAYRDVGFTATDGVRLSGWYLPSANGAAVVLLHGSGSTRSELLDQAAVLVRHGYGVLLYDARGHGRSAGRAMDFGWFGDRDLGGAVAFLQHQADVNPTRIAALGLSMGGEEALGAAATIPAIRAVVAEGATNRMAADKAWLSRDYGLPGTLTQAVERLTYAFADLLTSAGPPISLHDAARAMAPRPALLIAAGEVTDEAHAATYIRGASPDTVQVWVVPGSGHTRGLQTQPAAWEQHVASFLDHALGSSEVGARP